MNNKESKINRFSLLLQFLGLPARVTSACRSAGKILLEYAVGLYLFSLFVPRVLVRQRVQKCAVLNVAISLIITIKYKDV